MLLHAPVRCSHPCRLGGGGGGGGGGAGCLRGRCKEVPILPVSTALVEAYIKVGRSGLALSTLASVEAEGATPDSRLLVGVIAACGTTRGVAANGWRAVAVFDSLPQKGIQPTPDVFRAIVATCCDTGLLLQAETYVTSSHFSTFLFHSHNNRLQQCSTTRTSFVLLR